MKNDVIDVFSIIKSRPEFKKVIDTFNLGNNKELEMFLHYNAHNEMPIESPDSRDRTIYFRNFDTDKVSKIVRGGYLHFIPKDEDVLSPANEMTAFAIGKGIKCVRINGNGLFIENIDLKGNIITQYYDMAALTEIGKEEISIIVLDYIEEYIKSIGIRPDRIISAERVNDRVVTMSIIENNEVVKRSQVKVDGDRTLYSVYFEYMKANRYYGDNIQVRNINRRK